MPEVVPEEAEAARQKRGPAALWMATLPIKLPVRPSWEPRAEGTGEEPPGWAGVRPGLTATSTCPQRLQGCEGPTREPGLSLAPLNLGDAETGFLTQSNLLNVAGRLGPDWPAVALHLGLPYHELQRIRHEFRSVLSL